ncbi:MAG: Tripartite-type tricarboxylate transporter, receptor component TctC [Betaproteobacteria bacterium]|nr:Tripartite-type tricarboxylate transporter, receptor component TctC [Betaproteobacteria bacterium]
MRTLALRLFLCSVALLYSASALAADYPNHTVTMIVPNPPGGASDINARLLVNPLAAALKQPVVILNKPGMGGAIGTAQAATSKADGYTILLALSVVVVAPEAERISGRKPPYELDQLEPVALMSSDPMLVVVRQDAPWRNANDFLMAARAAPGKLTYASSGNFGPIHLSMAMLTAEAKVNLLHVPFNGGGPAVLALLSGNVDATTGAPSVVAPQITAGKIRPIAVSSAKRIAAFPDVPTYRELGYDAEYYIWASIYVPTGTPPEATHVLREAMKTAVHAPEFTTGMAAQGLTVAYMDAPEFKAYADADAKRMIRIVRRIGKVD